MAGGRVPIQAILIWTALVVAIAVPIVIAATSPLLAWRQPVYIAAGLAGVTAMALVLIQPLLAGGYLPGLPAQRGRRVHRAVGIALVMVVASHVAGLWVTSPPDVIDALLFTSPTPFSPFGVVAMWAVFGAALLAALRKPLRIRPRIWRLGHTAFVMLIAACSVVHALLIEGTMGTVSKGILCALVLAATAKVIADLRTWTLLARSKI
ncbi:MAG: ferric reductase-like transmembrane domain-containing protein [Rhodobiaceae bacterium]|nr:ferric reductase-like transmembrane domain-containing protein [Rhodobiaceae bacterium]